MESLSATRRRYLNVGVGLELFSIAWMVVEGAVGIGSGVIAHSVSLEAFGADSALELISAAIVLWWLRLSLRGDDPERIHAAGERAERLVGTGLLLLAVYVVAGAVYQLGTQSRPEASTAGLILAAVAVVIMPVLYRLKRANAERLESGAMRGDAIESLGCAWMAAALLVGLGLHHLLGWWWADPVAALLLAVFLVREGWEGIREWFESDDQHECNADDVPPVSE